MIELTAIHSIYELVMGKFCNAGIARKGGKEKNFYEDVNNKKEIVVAEFVPITAKSKKTSYHLCLTQAEFHPSYTICYQV